jgi:hypothetical protein
MILPPLRRAPSLEIKHQRHELIGPLRKRCHIAQVTSRATGPRIRGGLVRQGSRVPEQATPPSGGGLDFISSSRRNGSRRRSLPFDFVEEDGMTEKAKSDIKEKQSHNDKDEELGQVDVGDLEDAHRVVGDRHIVCNQLLYHLQERAIEHAVIPWREKHKVFVTAYSRFGHGDFPTPHAVGGRVLAEALKWLYNKETWPPTSSTGRFW